MSDSGGTEEDLGFYGDITSPLKSAKSSSVDSPPCIGKNNERHSVSSSPLLETQPLPVEDISICPYCNKNFRKPRVLDCLHSMCEDCVIAQLDGRNDVKRGANALTDFELEQTTTMRPTPPGVIRCPICSQESHVGNDVRFVNFMLLDFIRLRHMSDQESEKGDRICRACKGEQPAVANCRHCCSDLCKNCVQAHRDMKMFDGHKVVLFSEAEKEPVKNELPVEMALCSLHQCLFEQICTNCDEVICKNCLPEHRDHNCTPINEQVYQYCKSKITQIVNELETKGQATADARSAIPERLVELSTTYERCRNKVEQSFQTFVEVIEDLKLQVFSDLEKKRDEQEEYYNNLYNKIDLKMTMMQDALGFTNRLLEKGTKVELCASRKKIYQQLLMLHRSMPDMNTEFDIDFETLPTPELRKKFEAFIGTVQCRVTAIPSKDMKNFTGLVTSDAELRLCGDNRVNKFAAMPGGWNYAMNNLSGAAGAQSKAPFGTSTPIVSNGIPNPGTIGMERRRLTNSQEQNMNMGNGFSQNFDISGMFCPDMSNALPSVNGSVSHNSSDIFNINRLSLDGFVPTTIANHSGLTSANSFNSLELANLAGAFQDPFNQSKVWGSNFNNSNTFGFNLDNSMTNRPKMDQRFGADFGIGGNANFDVSSFIARSSQCNTPAFDGANFSMAGNATHSNVPASRLGSTIEMSLNTSFGSSGIESLNTPQGITLGLEDEIAIADTNNHRCVIVNTNGKMLRSLGGSGTEEGSFYFPRKIVSLVRGHECRYIVLDRGATQLFNRLQLFRNDGDFICRLITVPYHVEQINVMAVNKENDQLVIVDNKNNVIAFSIETVPQIRPVHAFNITGFVHEASDIAVYKGMYYITDYKTHAVVVYSLEGKFVHKFGNNTLTPYPVGIDISKSGDILVGDSHGNHYHIVVFNSKGIAQQDYKCMTQKVSRCTGLKITAEGLVITMSRQNSSVLIFNTLYMPSV